MKRKRYSPEKKVSILREHLEKNISVADICEKYQLHPNQFYQWRKQLFENAVAIFNTKKERQQVDLTTNELKNKIKERNEVIAELLQKNLQLDQDNGKFQRIISLQFNPGTLTRALLIEALVGEISCYS